MSDLNLVRYYQRLAVLGIGIELKTALPDLADIMCTSPRHARNLLKQMQVLGWLNWNPKVGRSRRSTLVLNHHLSELKELLASKRILAGKYQQALTILEQDQMTFGRLLQTTSGASLREGLLHIQLTYKRPFERLVPHHLQRASERYFIRQLYCCLVKSTHQGELEPQLAHHWQYDSMAFTWIFYLRPGLTFHNGTPIDGPSITKLFNKLITLDHYKNELKHVASIDSPTNNKVIFKLTRADRGFGGLLSGVKYAIQPPSQVNDSSNKHIVGSGPFQVTEHSESKLCLQAFDHFYACRALTDQVTIWPLDEQELKTNQRSFDRRSDRKPHNEKYYVSHAVSQHIDHNVNQTRIEEGSMYILFNQRAQLPLTADQRRYLSGYLTPQAIYRGLEHEGLLFGCEIARSLLPMWKPITRPTSPEVTVPESISIAIYDYAPMKSCTFVIQQLLERQGINVTINTYSYRELNHLAQTNQLQETLIINNLNLDDNRHASAFSGLYHNPVIHHGIGLPATIWLKEQLDALRATIPLNQYLDRIEPIASVLVHQDWLIPLFHHRLTLRFQGVLEDVELTNWGWPDITNVWSNH